MIPLYKPFMPEIPELDAILHSGKLAIGAYTKEFEQQLSVFFSTKYVTAVNSFNSAISVVITTLGLEHGDEVIVSPMACLASTQPYAAEGLRIVWADIDPHTGTLSPDSVKSRITAKTKAIVHNHFCGYPGYIDEINAIGREYGIFVIDDGIECFGTTYHGKLIGNCGTDASVFSFNPVRVLTTIDGGAILFSDNSRHEKSLLIRDCGIDRSIFRDDLGEINPDCDIFLQGYSATLSNVNAYIGCCQMSGVRQRIEKQRNNAERWNEVLGDFGPYKPLKNDNGEPNYWVYGVLSPNKLECIMTFRELGYYASGVHMRNDIYSVFGGKQDLPGVNEFNNSFVALPCGWWVENSLILENRRM